MRARAPGSVTTAFAPAGEDGGGISLATEAGVVAEVTPAAATRITLDGESTAFEPVAIALERLGVCAEVALEAAVPVGRGFGASGAATLATVLAAAAEFDLDRDRAALVDLAADAERAAGTGQSDVYVQETGGLAYDAGAGRGRRERTDRVAWATWAGVSTAAVLGDAVAMERIGAAAAPVFERFDPGADLATLLDLGWSFARETGLVTDRVREAVERVRAAGGAATMAMVGETVVATPAAPLSAPAFDGAVTGHTRVDTRGAELLD